jgi:hypothetical protein
MVDALNIGLNLSTLLLINVLIIAVAVAVTREPLSTAGGVLKLILCVTSFALLAFVVSNLPHEPLF